MNHDHPDEHGGHQPPAAAQAPPSSHQAHGHGGVHHAGMEAEFRQRFYVTAVLTIPVLLLSPMIQEWLGFSLTFPGQMLVLWGLASIIAIWGAWPFYRGAAQALPTGTFDMNVLVSVAVASGYLFSTAATFFFAAPEFYWEISTLVVFLLFGHWMEMRSLRGATGALRELIKLIPPSANRIVDDRTETVPTEQLHKGDLLLVRPGDQVPIDGEVIDGESEVNESLLTGESRPVPKEPGDTVIGGSLNGSGAFRMRVTATGKETAVAQIVTLIEEAQASKTRTQRLADVAAQYLTIIALVVGIGAFVVWMFFTQAGLVFALLRMVTVLIVACPHALGLAIPTVVIISSTLGAHAGILIRNNEATETAVRLNSIIFDKTGTLTKGEFGVTDVIPFGTITEQQLLQLTAALEANSEHSIAQGIVRSARERNLPVSTTGDFRAVPGRGAQATVNGQTIAAGNRVLMEQFGIDVSEAAHQADTLTSQGKTLVYVARGSDFAGLIALADVIRPESYTVVRDLKALGIEVAMLTGDHTNVAAYVAGELGLDTYFAEVQPGQKADKVKALQAEGKRVGMVGDGINDAPALVQADIGIAIGAGTQVAIESADIVLVRDDPRDVVSLIRLSRATLNKMKQNLVWATGYNVIAIPVAAGVLAGYGIVLRPEWAALLMAASSIIVVINALLLRRTRIAPIPPAVAAVTARTDEGHDMPHDHRKAA
ncbi:MAG: Copper-exporting P-type ATPase B [bacterium ADurb.Bin429]|nr:MAG: Copper-exporting P-type ATPase B [bacterium ADurb.Bin429]